MAKGKLQYPVPLIYPFHVDSALKLCEGVLCKHALSMKDREQREKELSKAGYRASMAQHMINFGFYGSLRESEFSGLRIRNVIFDEHGMIVCVRESKSNNGKRNIPLFALATDSYQEQFKAYYEKRLSEATSGDDWLFPDYDGSRLNANYMAGRIQAVFNHIGIRNMVFHDLRHGFANFFMLRWFHAFHPEYFSQDLSILKNGLFHEPYISRLKKLILGESRKTGQEHFTHGIAALSILIGHGGPIMTLEEYIHTADWLFYLISKSLESKEISYTCQQAANFLQVSYPYLPATFRARGKKTIKLSSLLYYQFQGIGGKGGKKTELS
jgi:hypothetical protein